MADVRVLSKPSTSVSDFLSDPCCGLDVPVNEGLRFLVEVYSHGVSPTEFLSSSDSTPDRMSCHEAGAQPPYYSIWSADLSHAILQAPTIFIPPLRGVAHGSSSRSISRYGR